MDNADFVCYLLFWQQDENCKKNSKERGYWINLSLSRFMKLIKQKNVTS
jgi:hypothetical protein